MGSVSILAGDFGKKEARVIAPPLRPAILSIATGLLRFTDIPLEDFERVEIQTEDSAKSLLGAAGWGLAGAALLGPVGLLAGLLLGGKKKSVCFAAYLKDGRKFLAVTDSKTYQKIQAAVF